MKQIHPSVYIAPGAQVIGDVTIGAESSVWFNAVVRGDSSSITIGERTNIQDLCVLHVDRGHSLTIGDDVTVGHGAIVHGCTVGNRVLVGMGAIILNDAVIGDDCIIGAGALVTGGVTIPAGSLVLGSPAKVVRPVTEEQKRDTLANGAVYVRHAREYKSQNKGE